MQGQEAHARPAEALGLGASVLPEQGAGPRAGVRPNKEGLQLDAVSSGEWGRRDK